MTAFSCPVCSQSAMDEGDFSTCDVCNWENDPSQLANADLAGGANDFSLNEARIYWKVTGQPAPSNRTPAMQAAIATVRNSKAKP